jgi:hypothetical protein
MGMDKARTPPNQVEQQLNSTKKYIFLFAKKRKKMLRVSKKKDLIV